MEVEYMIFTVSTTPLISALDLGVVTKNISKFYQKSCIAQITATRRDLIINLEAKSIRSEVRLKGSGDEDVQATAFVDCSILKQLVATFEGNITSIEFVDGGLVLHNSKSEFTLPNLVEGTDLQLNKPNVGEDVGGIAINQDDWKFIQDHQMYAIAMSFIHPVYTTAYVDENGDVMIGDYDNSIFTLSHKSKLGRTCLLSDTIINLFNNLPEGAKIAQMGKSYLVNVKTDSFEYIAEFTPDYEDDERYGSYNADIIRSTMEKNEEAAVTINGEMVNKFLTQAKLISSNSDDIMNLEVTESEVKLSDSNTHFELPLAIAAPVPYKAVFKKELLKSVVANFDQEDIQICPLIDEEEGITSGVVFWTDEMTTVLACVE